MTLLKEFLYDTDAARRSPELWLAVAAILTIGYLVFGLLLVGIPELSRGASMLALASFCWAVLGFITGTATLRPILILPMIFYFITVTSGLALQIYPIDYIGKVSTVWLSSISIGFFLMNGLSVRIFIAGLLATFVANMVAISVGYEGYNIVTLEQTIESVAYNEVSRSSGLAGQSNLLLLLSFSLPFAFFLLERKVNILIYIMLAGVCIATTVLTGSRSGIVLSALFIVLGGLFLLKNGWAKFFLIFVGTIASIFAIDFANNRYVLSEISNSAVGDIVVVERTIAGLDGIDNSADSRQGFVSDSWEYYAKKPLLGYGPDKFREVVGQGYYAHNNFVEIGINWGLAGQISYYLCYLAILIGIFKRQRVVLLTPLLFLALCDLWFVSFIERPAVLLLCAMLAVSSTPRPRHGSRSKRKRRSRRKVRKKSPIATQT